MSPPFPYTTSRSTFGSGAAGVCCGACASAFIPIKGTAAAAIPADSIKPLLVTFFMFAPPQYLFSNLPRLYWAAVGMSNRHVENPAGISGTESAIMFLCKVRYTASPMRALKILVVDDFDRFRALVCLMPPDTERFEVVDASDGLAAVRKAQT